MADLSPTYYNVGYLDENGASLADLVRAIFNCSEAIEAICNNLDEDAATLGTDYLSKIGTDFATAMAKIKTPTGGSVT